ncbi:signal peptidase I [Candidatus Falkowbacteria bacterium RBG_13_39_14]|uniref:Signal peptidase I n=1 Tax=Candidatus Falkowbacteria bacterium RBG_13_39_14 TaxID=1797985 RepID=A0A1F5S0T2_9BACT|nr:MAG: signal peptidase I [Candidatus Falkowbacteria bacterium RBG_13_39_14]
MTQLKKSDDFQNNEKNDFEFPDDNNKSFIAKTFSFLLELIKTVIISLAIILPIRYFIIQPFYVKGASMEPNFHDKDYLIINEFAYRFNEPERGDIVIFKNPRNPKEFFIKRIIGLPIEKIKIYDNKVYLYNSEYPEGNIIEELYLPEGRDTRGNEIIELKGNEYYVLGDNRDHSLDSRTFGPIAKDSIIGKVWVRGWPLDKFTIFEEEKYNL